MRRCFNQDNLFIQKIFKFTHTCIKKFWLMSLFLILKPIVSIFSSFIVDFLFYLENRQLNISFQHRSEFATPKIYRLLLFLNKLLEKVNWLPIVLVFSPPVIIRRTIISVCVVKYFRFLSFLISIVVIVVSIIGGVIVKLWFFMPLVIIPWDGDVVVIIFFLVFDWDLIIFDLFFGDDGNLI